MTVEEQRYSVYLIPSRNFGWVGVRAALERMDDIRIVGQESDPDRALTVTAAARPALGLGAADVGGMSPVALASALRARSPETRIALLGELPEPEELGALMYAGLDGYLLWEDIDADALRVLIAGTVAGGLFVASRRVVEALAGQSAGGPWIGPVRPAST